MGEEVSEEIVPMLELSGNLGELKGPIVFYRNRVVSTKITGGNCFTSDFQRFLTVLSCISIREGQFD